MKLTFCYAPKQALVLAAYLQGSLVIGTIASLNASVRVILVQPDGKYLYWDTTSDPITGEVSITISATQSDFLRSGGDFRICILNLSSGEIEYFTANGVSAESASINFVDTCPIPAGPHTLVLLADVTCPGEECGCTSSGNVYLKTEFISASAGAEDAGKPVKLNGSGEIDNSMLQESVRTEKMSMPFLGDGDALSTGSFKFPIPRSLSGFNVVFCDVYLEDSGTSGTNSFMLHNVTDAVDVLTGNITMASGGGGWATTGAINAATDDAAALDIWQLDIVSAATDAAGPAFLLLEFRLP